jgi:hypothetical protein
MNDRVVVQARRIAARKVAGEMVVLSADDSSLYVFNGVGTAVWEAVEEPTAVSTIVERICRDYDIDAEQARLDVVEFVDGLLAHGVLMEQP